MRFLVGRRCKRRDEFFLAEYNQKKLRSNRTGYSVRLPFRIATNLASKLALRMIGNYVEGIVLPSEEPHLVGIDQESTEVSLLTGQATVNNLTIKKSLFDNEDLALTMKIGLCKN
jgi:hypothetical protein